MITKILVSALIAAGAGVVVAAPAIADPVRCGPTLNATPFCGLSQLAPSDSGPAASTPINQGIQQGISDLHGTQGQH